VSEDELQRIVDMPMWLVTAATDNTVEPERFPVPLYAQLRNLGAENIHLSFLPQVVDRYVSTFGTSLLSSGGREFSPRNT